MSRPTMRLMSMGYGVTFSVGALALAFAGIALGGLYLLRTGGDPFDAIDHSGAVCLVLAFGMAFLLRLVLWERSSPAVRNATRAFLTVAQCVVAAAAIAALPLAMISPRTPGWLIWFAFLAFACGLTGLLWVVRYRRQL